MEDNEIFLKPVYKSKKDILNRILRLKTERDDNTSIISKIQNPHPIPKKFSNLTKKNLTYQNFLEYTYDYNNITEKRIRMPDHLKIKQKYELMLDSDYSTNISKKTKKKITPLLITGLNTPINNKYKKLNNFFSASQKSFQNNSELKTKSSSNKFTKSIFNNYNSSNKNDLLYPSEISSNLPLFQGEVEKFTKNENKDEGLRAFVQKSRIILKGNIIKKDLKDKLTYYNDLCYEEMKVINEKERQLRNNLKMLDIFEEAYIHYLRRLEGEEDKERRNLLFQKNKKMQLENDITNLQKKIETIKIKLLSFQNIKSLFEYSQRDSQKNNNTKKNEVDANKKNALSNKQLELFSKNLLIQLNKKMLSYRKRRLAKQAETAKKNLNPKYNSLRPSVKEPKLNLKDETNKKKPENSNSKNNLILNRRRSRRKSNISVHQKQYDHIFTDKENDIIRYIEIDFKKRNEKFEEKKTFDEISKLNKGKDKYMNELIAQKEEISQTLKEENKTLLMKKQFFSNINAKGLSEKVLEEKMSEIIENIKPLINIPKIIKIKNLYTMLEFKTEDFLERFHTSKVLFLLKTIELLVSYLISKKNQYLSDPKMKEALKNFLFVLENDKKIRMNRLNKNALKLELEKKKSDALDRATKIRFYSYRKMDLSYFKNKRHKFLKEKVNNKTMGEDQYENWILYD